MIPSERKPLAALVVEKDTPSPGADDAGGPDDDELGTAVEAASMLGAKDPQAAGGLLLDMVRQCIARSKAGKY